MFARISKSIIVLSKYSKNVASARVRIYNYKDLLAKDGYKLRIIPIERRHKETFNYLDKIKVILLPIIAIAFAPFFDVLLVHRFIPQKHAIIRLLRKLSKRFIFDYDERYHVDVCGQALPDGVLKYFHNMIRSCDTTIVSNSYLKTYSSAFNSNVEIIPSPIDIAKYPVKKHCQKYPIVVGWIGSGGAQQYLELLTEVFSRLYKKYGDNVYLEVVTSPVYRVKLETPLRVKHIDWRLEFQYQYFLNFDIGIMPIPDNARSMGKASYKALEYMACGIPVVASPIGMNNEVIIDKLNGFLPKSDNAWYEVLCRLIEDPALREQVGSKGRDVVHERFSLEKCYNMFRNILEKDVVLYGRGNGTDRGNRKF